MAKFNITVDLDWVDEDETIDEVIQEEIASQVISKISTNLDSKYEEKINSSLDEKLLQIDETINQKLNELMTDFFDTPRTITDEYGDVKEKDVTIKGKLKKACDNFLDEKVDENGNSTNGNYYGRKTMTRANFIVKKAITSDMEWQITNAVNEVIAKLKKEIGTIVNNKMSEKLRNITGIDDLINNL